jgi:hypothetical protein
MHQQAASCLTCKTKLLQVAAKGIVRLSVKNPAGTHLFIDASEVHGQAELVVLHPGPWRVLSPLLKSSVSLAIHVIGACVRACVAPPVSSSWLNLLLV